MEIKTRGDLEDANARRAELLSKRDADIADMHYNKDMTLREIAEVKGISFQRVHQIINGKNK